MPPNYVACYTGGSREVAARRSRLGRHKYVFRYLQFPTCRKPEREKPLPRSRRNFARVASLNCAVSTIVSMFAISKNAASLSSEAPDNVIARRSRAMKVRAPDANDTATMATRAPALIIAHRTGQATVIKPIWGRAARSGRLSPTEFSTTRRRVLSGRHPATASYSVNCTRDPRRPAAISPPNIYTRRGLRVEGVPRRAWRRRPTAAGR